MYPTKPKILLITILLIIAGSFTFLLLKEHENTALKVEIKKKPKEERIAARALQEYLMTRDPATGLVPRERLIEAREYRDALMTKLYKNKAKIPMLTWTNVGPDTVGGRTRAIMFDPTDMTDRRVFAAGVSGGLWKNDDITTKTSPWTKINDFLDNLAVVSLAFDPNNQNTWYAATGEVETSVTPGAGVFKSIDAGATWTHLASTNMFKFNSDVVVRNENGQSVVYLGSGQINVGSKLGDPVTPNGAFQGMSGLFRSDDGGTTWNQVLPQNNQANSQLVSDVRLDGSNNLLVAVGSNEFGDDGGDLYKCTGVNCNTAGTFTKILDEAGKRTIFDVAPSDPNRIYVVSQSNAAMPGNDDVGFFKKTIDGGTNWTDMPIPMDFNIDNNPCTEGTNHFTRAQAFYDLVLEVHPTDPDVFFVGGIDMYRTIDGGANFTIISSWVRDNSGPCAHYMHADQHAAVFRPGNFNQVVFGSDGGVAFSANAGDKNATPTFADHVQGYTTSQFYSCDISPTAAAREYLGGLQDNGSNEWDQASANNTIEVTGGDGGFAHIDQANPLIQITAFTENDYAYTRDEWATKADVTGRTMTGRFINPTDYDDTNKILYGASNVDALSRATGFGAAGAALTDDIPVGGATLGGRQASTIKVDPNTPTTIYVGTDNGKVFRINNANVNPLTSVDISPTVAQAPADTYVSSIDVQMGNSNHMLLTISNFGVKSVYESTDGGTTWVDIENNLPDIPVRWGIFSPANNDHALLATDMGIWTTDNINGGATSWEATNDGLANVRVDMIKYRTSDNTFVAGTHGRGMYTGNIGANNCNMANTTNVTQPDIVLNATFHNGHITSGAPMPNNVNINANNITFKGVVDVILNPQFEVTPANVFNVFIENCPM